MRFSEIRPPRTPNSWIIISRSSIPGPPFGVLEKSSRPSDFWSAQRKGQWSVETTERMSVDTACHRCSWFSFARGGVAEGGEMFGISVGGILVIVGVVVALVWSFWLGVIVALIGRKDRNKLIVEGEVFEL